MDAIFTTLLTQLPNIAIAVWCISNYQQTIKGLLDQQNKLLDQLLQARGLKVEQAQSSDPAASKADNPK